MDAVLHFFKHFIGLCGETHPSLLISGGVLLTTISVYFKQITEYLRSFL